MTLDSSKSFAESLNNAMKPNDPFFNKLVRIMATRCMHQAVYFCLADFDVAEVLINWTDYIFGNVINRETVEITNEQMAELNRRIEDHEKHPEKGIPWSEVRERLRKLC